MKAAKGDSRGIYGLAYHYFKLAKGLNGPFKKINFKILTLLREYKTPNLVNHQIVSNNPKSVERRG